MKLFFYILVVPLVIYQMIIWWIYSKGKLHISYPLQAIAHLWFILVETMLAFNDDSQQAILLFNLLNLYGFIMNIKGYLRLRKDLK